MKKPGTALQPDPDQLLSTREAAELLGISTRKLWEISNRREIELVRIGRKVLYRRAAVLSWIELQTQAAATSTIEMSSASASSYSANGIGVTPLRPALPSKSTSTRFAANCRSQQ